MGDSNWIDDLNLEDIDDELELRKLLDETDDIEERKAIRARLKEVMAMHRAEREAILRRRDQDRENLLRKKVADAEEQKRRTLAMYDAMAKSAPAGGHKSLDVSILRTGVPSSNPTPIKDTPPVDLVEEAIRQRQRDSEINKQRVLAAFDKAARSGPAGAARIVDFDNVTSDDITAPKVLPRKVEEERDIMEEAIRKRKAEADERKRRTLAAYDQAAKARPAGGPISVYIPQNFDIEPVISVEKSSKPISPKDKFRQMDAATSSNVTPKSFTPVKVALNSPTSIKEMLLNWVKSKTKTYQNISIDNFSSSWSNGLAFCALIHHFYPNAFDYLALDPKRRRENFTLAFKVAEEKADIAPLLDVDDMVMMKKPDWKCVFTYVQSFYRRFKDGSPQEGESNE